MLGNLYEHPPQCSKHVIQIEPVSPPEIAEDEWRVLGTLYEHGPTHVSNAAIEPDSYEIAL